MAFSLSAPGTFYALWQLPEYYLLMAPDYTILDASDLYLAVTFKQHQAIVGQNVFDAFPRADQNYRMGEQLVALLQKLGQGAGQSEPQPVAKPDAPLQGR